MKQQCKIDRIAKFLKTYNLKFSQLVHLKR